MRGIQSLLQTDERIEAYIVGVIVIVASLIDEGESNRLWRRIGTDSARMRLCVHIGRTNRHTKEVK